MCHRDNRHSKRAPIYFVKRVDRSLGAEQNAKNSGVSVARGRVECRVAVLHKYEYKSFLL